MNERTCQKCGRPTHGEEALVRGKCWCHPCADIDTGVKDGRIAFLIKWCEVNAEREQRLANTVSGTSESAEIYRDIAAALRNTP